MDAKRRLTGIAAWGAAAVMAALVAATGYAPPAYAHGEAADEPFLKDLTVAFYDVHIAPTVVKVGEPVTITGKVKVLETWPFTLDPPDTGYINVVAPGPVFALRERTINGIPAIGSIVTKRGETYEFKMVMLGRMTGRWHVHPGIALMGTGTLLGPGEWVSVEPSGQPFVFPVTLLDGSTINLETVGSGGVWWWAIAAFLIGMVWMIYWTVPKRTVTRLAVNIQIPTPDIGKDFGLITDEDYKWSRFLGAITIGLLVIGWIYIESQYHLRLPQQTDRFAPGSITPSMDEMSKTVQVKPVAGVFDNANDTLTLRFNVANLGSSPLTVKQYTIGMESFVNGGKDEVAKAGPADFVAPLEVQNGTIAPGQSAEVTLKMKSEGFEAERLMPLRDPQELVGGLLFLQDAAGKTYPITVRVAVRPTEFRTQYF